VTKRRRASSGSGALARRVDLLEPDRNAENEHDPSSPLIIST
jgi:hypothetical protein